jgi:ABC-type Zn uptake system ZnuABC Zn-binding protein ZnuA
MRRRHAAMLAAVVALAGCGESGEGGGRPEVVATTTHAGDIVRAVAGDRVGVHTLLRANSDPHDYEPRPSDLRAVGDADLVVRSGGEVDDWLGDVLDEAGGDAPSVTLMDTVRRRGDDPHWWQDPRNVRRVVPAVRAALGRADPGGRAEFARRARAYDKRLGALDAGIARCVASVPRVRRKIVTTHDSLAYFARRYDIRVVGALIPSQSTQAQPSARDVDRLVRQIRRERVAAIFPESALHPKLERAVARESGARVGGRLWADALGPPGSAGDTYPRATAANARALVQGMSGGARTCGLAV